MKKFTYLAVCAAMVVATCQAAPAVKLPSVFRNVVKVRQDARKNAPDSKNDATRRYAAMAADVAPVWRAGTQKAFGWTGKAWQLVETYQIDYDDQGRKSRQTVTDMEGYVNRETYTWNENGQMATRLTQVDANGKGEFTDYQRLKREYDPRLVSFITFNDQQVYYNDNWMPSNSYKQTITRDDAGNVTLMERAVFFDGIYDPVYRFALSYGEDGKAETIVVTELTYDYSNGEYLWVESERYTDIVWEETDGQIVGLDDLDDLYIGPNRIKSATVVSEDLVLNLSVNYSGGNEFVATVTSEPDEEGFVLASSLSYSELDSSSDIPQHINHGYGLKTVTEVLIEDFPVAKEVITETYIYSPDDLIVLEKVEYDDGEISVIDSMLEGDIEYDEEHCYPLTWTLREYDNETGEMVEAFRAEYSDYSEFSTNGIAGVAADDSVAPIYYNLQGRQVKNPSAGVFIRVNGANAEKVMLP